MFIDDKIKEFIEHEKKEWQEFKEIWQKISEEIKITKNLCIYYLSTYRNDSVHQELLQDFNKILDNIESLANTFNFKTGMEIIIFLGCMIHNGYLSITNENIYNRDIEDINLFYNKTLNCSLMIFNGIYCCRHIAAFAKITLDWFNINNAIVKVDNKIEDYSICTMRLFLHNFHKKFTNSDHVINYIEENGFHYFLDITSTQPILYGAYNGLAYSVDGPLFILPLYSYSYSKYNDEFIDYGKVPQLTREQADYLIDIANATVKKCQENEDLLVNFSRQNIENYRRINENYNKVYEKEKRLRLIKSDESK